MHVQIWGFIPEAFDAPHVQAQRRAECCQEQARMAIMEVSVIQNFSLRGACCQIFWGLLGCGVPAVVETLLAEPA